jgi:hypothetical protein
MCYHEASLRKYNDLSVDNEDREALLDFMKIDAPLK